MACQSSLCLLMSGNLFMYFTLC